MFKIEFTPWIEAAHLEQAEVQPYVSETYAKMQQEVNRNIAVNMGLIPQQLGSQQSSMTATAEGIKRDIAKAKCVIKKGHSVGPSTFTSSYVCPRFSLLALNINSIINYRGA